MARDADDIGLGRVGAVELVSVRERANREEWGGGGDEATKPSLAKTGKMKIELNIVEKSVFV